MKDDPRLSRAERRVFALIGATMTSKEVARHIGVSPRTVEHHAEKIKAKLGLASSRALTLAWHGIGDEALAAAIAAADALAKPRKTAVVK